MQHRTAVFALVLSLLAQHTTGTVIQFFTEGAFDEHYVERDEQVNTLYHTLQGYGLDCYHHINQQFELRMYFRGRPVAGATVTSCSRNRLAEAIKVRPFSDGAHHVMVCTDELCNMFNFQDPHQDQEGQDRLSQPVSELPTREGGCHNDWCSFTDTDDKLKNEVFYFDTSS